MFSSVTNLNSQDIIPLPQNVNFSNDIFTITPKTKVLYTSGAESKAVMLTEYLSPATGWDFSTKKSNKLKSGSIFLNLDESLKTGDESYEMIVKSKGVEIKSATQAGLFYGIQSLLQLLPSEIYSEKRQKGVQWNVPACKITDSPVYKWRGMMLDVSRYFYDKQYVLKFLDMMAMYKMNVLHFHLIDDAGWRLEIKKYPKLTSIGAWRGEDENRRGGYYTQEDIKEIVAYATERNIDVVPEIEIPAHTLAAISAYPHLSCTEKEHVVPTQHFISRDLYCVGKESTFEFLADVFKEAFSLFPSKYIHIGGDEARYDRWRECFHCQKRKKDLGLKSEAELQVYFNRRVQKMVSKYGKTIVGWDEIIEDGLKEKAVGMVWHNKKKIFKATKMGHDVVMSLTGHTYFDVAESAIPGEVKAATWLKPISLQKAYEWDPMVEGLDEKYRKQVLGGNGCLWSDQFIHGYKLPEIMPLNENRSEQYFDYLTFPRMSALAEVCWTKKDKRSWDSFEKRMRTHYGRYDFAGHGYRVPSPKLIKKEKVNGGYKITVKNVVEGAEVRFSIDGTRANVYSPVCTSPVFVKNLQDFSAITVVNRRQYSLPLYFPVKNEKFKKFGKQIAEWKPNKVKGKVYSTLEMNATGKINRNGEYILTFLYTGGSYRLDIESVEVYKNGKKIAEDVHFGYTGGAANNNSYKFKIAQYETGAGFTIKAKVRGDEGNDSYGVVYLKRK